MNNILKKSMFLIAAILFAVVALFAQSSKKLYKNEKEKEELVMDIMQDQELKAALMRKMMADTGCAAMISHTDMKDCPMMKGENIAGMKDCPMMKGKDMAGMKSCPMMNNTEGNHSMCQKMCMMMADEKSPKDSGK